MKKAITLALTLMIASLAACGGKVNLDSSGADASKTDSEPAISLPAASITGQKDEFTKKLVPVAYDEGEQVGSLYYKSVAEDGKVFYEIQPEGEESPMRVPVSAAVIYVVGTAEECQVVKTHFDYSVEGSEPTKIEQYRIFAIADAGAIINGNKDIPKGLDTNTGDFPEAGTVPPVDERPPAEPTEADGARAAS